MNVTVPEPPESIVILQEDKVRLLAWIEFFQNLSPRVKVCQRNTDALTNFREVAESVLRRSRSIPDGYKLIGWPAPDQIAFAIAINSAPLGDEPCYKPEDAYFFCFDSIAFGLMYFNWDGDDEVRSQTNTFSLASYNPGALSWIYIKGLIVDKIKKMEERVPPLE